MSYRLLTLILILGTTPGCSKSKNPAASQASDPIQIVIELDPAIIEQPPVPLGSSPIRVGIFLSIHKDSISTYQAEHEAAKAISRFLEDSNTVFKKCNMHLVIEAAQVIALPDHLLRIQGNQEGSWGGHPPREVENKELFSYEQHERLTEDTRTLFGYGKRFTSPNAISIFTVEQIIYYAEQQRTAAGGLSYPPNGYHHPDDYPYRNSVLVFAKAPFTDFAALISRRIAHELGHMLLNFGDHPTSDGNLLNEGMQVTQDQCGRMNRNLVDLYGKNTVADPGPPSSL
jgi:hypothetical protein